MDLPASLIGAELPQETDEHILSLVREIGLPEDSVYLVPVKQMAGASANSCFTNVKIKVDRAGGTSQLGWLIAKNKFYYEAIAHSVWCSPDGEWTDITPRQEHGAERMFVPDDRVKDEAFAIPSHRLNHTGSRDTDILIRLWHNLDLVNATSFELPLGMGMAYPGDEYKLAAHRLEEQVGHYTGFLGSGGGDGHSCFCESGQKYETCHGKAERVTEIIFNIVKGLRLGR